MRYRLHQELNRERTDGNLKLRDYEENTSAMEKTDSRKARTQEVLIFDSSTFIREIGLMSLDGSALKHYLYCRGMRLAVPQVVAEECERKLNERAVGKKKQILSELEWLGRFCGGVNGWTAPDDEDIAARAKAFLITYEPHVPGSTPAREPDSVH